MTGTVYLYETPGSSAAALREAVHQRLLDHAANSELPTSNRFILYELRQAAGPLYGHKSRGQGRSEDQNLSDAVMWLRANGVVPWDWIVNETRSLSRTGNSPSLPMVSRNRRARNSRPSDAPLGGSLPVVAPNVLGAPWARGSTFGATSTGDRGSRTIRRHRGTSRQDRA